MVKPILKNNSITLSEFADLLCITRPTLDSYIKTYDYSGYLTNQTFNNVFEFLFSNPSISNEEFAERYAYIKRFFGRRTLEDSSSFHAQNFHAEAKAGSGLKHSLLDIISNNEFSDDALNRLIALAQSELSLFILEKELGVYALYEEKTSGIHYLVFKTGTDQDKGNSVKIDGLFHYVVFKTAVYDEMRAFVKEVVGEDIA